MRTTIGWARPEDRDRASHLRRLFIHFQSQAVGGSRGEGLEAGCGGSGVVQLTSVGCLRRRVRRRAHAGCSLVL